MRPNCNAIREMAVSETIAAHIIDSSDTQAVINAIERDRLSVMKAKERWQQDKG